MKKLLGLLITSSLLTINVTSIIACNTTSTINSEQNNQQKEIIIQLKPNKNMLEKTNKLSDLETQLKEKNNRTSNSWNTP